MLRLSRSLSRFETQDIMTQPQFNHYEVEAQGKGKVNRCPEVIINWQQEGVSAKVLRSLACDSML